MTTIFSGSHDLLCTSKVQRDMRPLLDICIGEHLDIPTLAAAVDVVKPVDLLTVPCLPLPPHNARCPPTAVRARRARRANRVQVETARKSDNTCAVQWTCSKISQCKGNDQAKPGKNITGNEEMT